jgi:hypothetical protein
MQKMSRGDYLTQWLQVERQRPRMNYDEFMESILHFHGGHKIIQTLSGDHFQKCGGGRRVLRKLTGDV